ncbi:MAG: DUF362 domain-containing protein [Deltaproteobacteria bacterium]|nr:DUF362 domain-containing protein [Deltaproteobacteria bacterium]
MKFADLNYYGAKGEAEPYECAGSGLLIPEIYYRAMKCGVIISAAKLKVHSFATVSLSLKNLIGAAMFSGDKKPSLSRAKIHAELQDYEKKKSKDAALFAEAEAAFGKRLAEMSYLLLPDIGVIEGVRGCGGDGLTVCETEESGVSFASENLISLDLIAAGFMGFADKKGLYLNWILKKFYPAIAPEQFMKKIKVIGNLPENEHNFKLTNPYY